MFTEPQLERPYPEPPLVGSAGTPTNDWRASNIIRGIEIKQLNRGYIVRVGCHDFAFETVDTMIEKITQYIKDPVVTEQIWFKGELF